MQMNKKWVVRVGVGAAGILCVTLLVLLSVGKLAGHESAAPTTSVSDNMDDDSGTQSAIAVTTIKPQRDRNFAMTYTEEPADVEPYYETKIEAQAAGPIEFIRKAIGSPVKKGEVLVKIAVPDREAALAWKQEVVGQRQKDVKLAEAQIEIAKAAVKEADQDIELRKGEAEVARYTKNWRHQELDRIRQLASGPSPAVTPEMLDEQISKTGIADAEYNSAQHAVDKAKADKLQILAKLERAKADLDLQKSMVRVAERDRDLAQALVNYATVTSPYVGEIKDRNVAPGSLVQNASNGTAATPMLTVQRTDIVTVQVRLPDKYAPYITTRTDAMIELTDLPGLVIHGKVTRRSPSLLNAQHDRTIEVKVDLYNGTNGEYKKWLSAERATAKPFDDLREGPLPVPLYPNDERVGDPEVQRLMPGMIGKMTLVLKKFKNSYLVPNSVIVEQGGTPFVYIVKNGVAHLQQVKILVNDENLAKIGLVTQSGKNIVTNPLTGNEEIVYTGQGELSDGSAVKTHLEEWHR